MKTILSITLAALIVTVIIAVLLPPSLSTTSATGQTEDRGFKIGTFNPNPSAQDYQALVIGNNNYAQFKTLKTAINDAETVADVLQNTYGFKATLLRNATRDQIIRALNEYRRSLKENSSFIIYYAGHGHYDEEVDKAYWLPVDAERDSNGKWISADDVTTNIKGMLAGHILIISDSCYSGMIVRDSNLRLNPAERTRYLQKMMEGRSRILMSSGSNEPVSDGGGAGHSVFAAALLRGLLGMEEATFTAEELFYQYIRESVAGKSEQTPQYSPIRNSGHDGGDFVFMRRNSNPNSSMGINPANDPNAKSEGIMLQRVEFVTATLNAKGDVINRRKGTARSFTEELGGGIQLELVEILGGAFHMGSAASEAKDLKKEMLEPRLEASEALKEFQFELPKHKVDVPKFFMGRYEITMGQWRAVSKLPKVKKDMDSYYLCKDCANDDPVMAVTWDMAVEFCERLSRATGRRYRLPSEAEWEYACRAGTSTAFDFGEMISPKQVTFGIDGFDHVGKKWDVSVGRLGLANQFGLCDMHGNASEFCLDSWHESYFGAPPDGTAWIIGGDPGSHVLRGGAWYSPAWECRSAARTPLDHDSFTDAGGFRVVMEVPSKSLDPDKTEFANTIWRISVGEKQKGLSTLDHLKFLPGGEINGRAIKSDLTYWQRTGCFIHFEFSNLGNPKDAAVAQFDGLIIGDHMAGSMTDYSTRPQLKKMNWEATRIK